MAAKKQQVSEGDESFVAKLSLKALGCDPRLPKGETRQLLCHIYGKAGGLKHGEDKNTGSLWTALQGTFEGVNMQEGSEDFGKKLQSGKCFLPAGIQDAVEAKVREIENSAKGTVASGNVQFAIELWSVKANNPIGYSYEAKSLVKPIAGDELSELRKAIAEAAPKRIEAAKK